jgi:hypothetical protein
MRSWCLSDRAWINSAGTVYLKLGASTFDCTYVGDICKAVSVAAGKSDSSFASRDFELMFS